MENVFIAIGVGLFLLWMGIHEIRLRKEQKDWMFMYKHRNTSAGSLKTSCVTTFIEAAEAFRKLGEAINEAKKPRLWRQSRQCDHCGTTNHFNNIGEERAVIVPEWECYSCGETQKKLPELFDTEK